MHSSKYIYIYSIPTSTINGICDMTEIVHRRNVFEFNRECFIKTSGTAIGTKLAPCYAYIFERDMLNQYPIRPSIWLRYVDDIIMIWYDSEDKLKDFLAYINPAIQFTHAYSFKSVNFKDVLATITDDGTISTVICTKPTDTHQYLHMNSCHPNHVKKLLRFRRRHRLYASVVTQPQRNALIENLVRRGHGRRRTQLEVQRAIDAY